MATLVAVGALALVAAGCSDDVDGQVDDAQEFINDESGDPNAYWDDFEDADCERFSSLDNDETTTCTATATSSTGNESAPATVVVTLDDCRDQSGDDAGRTCENMHYEYDIDVPPLPKDAKQKK